MGKRKSKATKIMKAPPPKVEKVFDCPFCHHQKTVEVKLQRPQKKATLKCRICRKPYEVRINQLTLEVDVFCQWIDECERLETIKRKHETGQGLGLVQ
jgi:transcription elongation factor Elf1